MYFYRIGYHSFEECPHTTVIHEKKYNKDEIEFFIIEAIKKLIPQKDLTEDYSHNFSDFYRDYEGKDIIHVLCSDFGFKRLEYNVEYSAFGWASIFDNKDWKNDRGEELTFIASQVKHLKPKKSTKDLTK